MKGRDAKPVSYDHLLQEYLDLIISFMLRAVHHDAISNIVSNYPDCPQKE